MLSRVSIWEATSQAGSSMRDIPKLLLVAIAQTAEFIGAAFTVVPACERLAITPPPAILPAFPEHS